MDYDYRENMQNQEPNQVQNAPSAEKKKKRKGMTGPKIVALALACAMVGGVTGGAAMSGVLHLTASRQ